MYPCSMRLAVAAGLLLALGLPTAAPAGEAVFAAILPDAVGDVSTWTVVTGDFETPTERGRYRFYVNPGRAAMYQLMRYRVELIGPSEAAAGRSGDAERVAFVQRPGVREPMLFWTRQPPGASPAWRPLVPGSHEYLVEIGVIMRVLAAHRAARGIE